MTDNFFNELKSIIIIEFLHLNIYFLFLMMDIFFTLKFFKLILRENTPKRVIFPSYKGSSKELPLK